MAELGLPREPRPQDPGTAPAPTLAISLHPSLDSARSGSPRPRHPVQPGDTSPPACRATPAALACQDGPWTVEGIVSWSSTSTSRSHRTWMPTS